MRKASAPKSYPLKHLGNKTGLCFFYNETTQFVLNYDDYYLSTFKGIKAEDNLLKREHNSWVLNTGRSQPVSWAASKGKKNSDAPELPFFFLDKDSICHRAIYSLRVRISMISNHSASLLSPWHHLCNTSKNTGYTHPIPQATHQALCFRQAFKATFQSTICILAKCEKDAV